MFATTTKVFKASVQISGFHTLHTHIKTFGVILALEVYVDTLSYPAALVSASRGWRRVSPNTVYGCIRARWLRPKGTFPGEIPLFSMLPLN